jgi:hypothetical protein
MKIEYASGSALRPTFESVVIFMRIATLFSAVFLVSGVVYGQPEGAAAASSAPSSRVSGDCGEDAARLPKGYSRIYIALRNGKDGSGRSLSDARDGSTAANLDTILRCLSEGCPASDGQKAVPKTEKLIVCIGPGVFQTKGAYDFLIAVPRTSQQGFTIGKGWKIHGSGAAKTTIQLIDYRRSAPSKDPETFPAATAHGVVFSTNSDDASGIEISDLTVDANYPQLKVQAKQQGIKALNLEAIHLRSNEGGHWIYHVNVINTSGEVGGMFGTFEIFPVWITSVSNTNPAQNNGNLIENVTMSQFHGGLCTAIAVANALVEVRNNYVDGYQIGYGGWSMGRVWFHDNVAIRTDYGFNIDSLNNDGVKIESNQIIAPKKFGFVIGGGGTYTRFHIFRNTIQIKDGGVSGILFQGNVTKSVIEGNTLTAERSAAGNSIAIKNYSASRQIGANQDNTYQSNRIDSSLKTAFYAPSRQSQNCFSGNMDERGNPRKDLKDNHAGPCVAAGK